MNAEYHAIKQGIRLVKLQLSDKSDRLRRRLQLRPVERDANAGVAMAVTRVADPGDNFFCTAGLKRLRSCAIYKGRREDPLRRKSSKRKRYLATWLNQKVASCITDETPPLEELL